MKRDEESDDVGRVVTSGQVGFAALAGAQSRAQATLRPASLALTMRVSWFHPIIIVRCTE